MRLLFTVVALVTLGCASHANDGPASGGGPGAGGGGAGAAGGGGGNARGLIELEVVVKESTGTASEGFPMSMVVPLPAGRYSEPSGFSLVDDAGAPLPIQVEVLNRWWGRDDSIRHLLVHFAPDVPAYAGPGTGSARFVLRDEGDNPAPERSVRVDDDGSRITLSNGLVSFEVTRSPFSISTPSGPLTATFAGESGAEALFGRSDIEVAIEETGPMRAVLKANSATRYGNGDNPAPGFALRLYLYADQRFAKLDFQLHNADRFQPFAGPLYFEGLRLSLATGQPVTPASVRAETLLEDPKSKPVGALAAPGTGVAIRNFWETWPNGIAVDAGGTIDIELWPSWSAQLYHGELSSTGLYWLDDMQQVHKEILLDFGDDLEPHARLLQYPPVAVLPPTWYDETRATLDLGGVVPNEAPLGGEERRLPSYEPSDYDLQPATSANGRYQFGWSQFKLDTYRQLAVSVAGGWPYSSQRFYVSGDPADYYDAQSFALGELNGRPQWLDGYVHARDQALVGLTSNGDTWRRFDGNGAPSWIVAYRPETGALARPRDDQHGWFQHIEDAYYQSGNLWIRDWYRFIAEFRKVRLNQEDPWPNMVSRSLGHTLMHALSAYRATGDDELLELVRTYLDVHVGAVLDSDTGINAWGPAGESVFQMGYLGRAIISYLGELEGTPAEADPHAFGILERFVAWNMAVANFCYYHDPADPTVDVSNGTAMTFIDPQLWLYAQTGEEAIKNHVEQFVQSGIPAGVGALPYGELGAEWQGTYEGRLYADLLGQ